jgi:Retrotransposon gag protein
MRFRLYLEDRLANGIESRSEIMEIFRTKENFLSFFSMSYRDLNEARTAELKFNRLRQTGTFPEYLAKFTGFIAQVAWDERARMARLYEGLSTRIKDAMAVREFPDNWVRLVNLFFRLNDNFRRRDVENKR